MNKKIKMRLQMEIGRRGLIQEDKHVFKQIWGNLWYLPGNDKKLSLKEATEAGKCRKRSRDREINGEDISRQRQRMQGAPNTGEHQVMRFITTLSS